MGPATMNRLDLDFAPRNLRFWWSRAGVVVWMALVSATLALGVGLWVLYMVRTERQGAQDALARTALASPPAQERASPAPTSPQSMDSAQVKAMNQALLALNRPWSQLWDALDRVSSARGVQVAILEMRPETTTADQDGADDQGLRLLVESQDSAHMLGFLRQLRSDPFFVSMVLSSHQVNAQDPNNPLRFEVKLHWSQASHAH